MQRENQNKQHKSGEEKKEGYVVIPNYFLREWVRVLGVGPVVLYQIASLSELSGCPDPKKIVDFIGSKMRIFFVIWVFYFLLTSSKQKSNRN